MTLKSDAKFEEKLTLGSKNGMRNLVNFHPPFQKSKNFTLIDYFFSKYMRFELTYTEELSFMTLWFQKWHEKLGELSLDHPKSEKLYIDGLFLSKAYDVSARKFQRNYVS